MKLSLRFVGAAVALAVGCLAQQPPHVVIILADDLGWTDLSTGRTCRGNGSPFHRTPNLDALAEQGTCFLNAYSNAPNCAPTRAALWSGQWAARTRIYTVASGNRGKQQFRKLDAAPNETRLDPSVVTLAASLHKSGYTTGHFGKWHLGDEEHGSSPQHMGFDHAVGGNHRGSVNKSHFADADGNGRLPGLTANGKAKQFLADRLTDEAIEWMGETKAPLFCCISHYSVHTPVQAPADDVRAVGNAPEGSRHRHRKYAAMMKNLDDNVGRVLRFLEGADDPVRPGKKLIDNCLVIFTSDNGGVGGYAAAGIKGGAEITTQLPLRSGKGSLYEGGVRVPFVVRWNGHVRPKASDETPLQLMDLYPTLLAIAGAGESPPQVLDGVDLSPRFRMQPKPVDERALFCHFPGYLAANGKRGTWRTTPGATVRRGRWKALFFYETRTWSLFDLDADIGEHHDVASEHPEELRALASSLRAWLVDTEAPRPRELGGGEVPPPHVPE